MGAYRRQAKKYVKRYAPYVVKGAKTAYNVYKNVKKVHGMVKKRKRTITSSTGGSTSNDAKRNKTLISNGEGTTHSHYSHENKVMKDWVSSIKGLPKDIVKYYASGISKSQYGIQQVLDMNRFLDAKEILDIFNQCIDTNVALRAALSTDASEFDKKLWLHNFSAETLISNMGPGTVNLIIYDLQCIEDCNEIMEPSRAWQAGISNSAGINPAEELLINWPGKPYDSTVLRKYWKIVKTTKVEIHTGRTHEHKINVKYNGLLPYLKANEIFNNSGSAGERGHFRGVTHVSMIVHYGMPASDGTFSGFEPPVLDRTKLAIITSKSFQSSLINFKSRHVAYAPFPDVNNEVDYAQQNPDGQGTHTTKNDTGVNAVKTFS